MKDAGETSRQTFAHLPRCTNPQCNVRNSAPDVHTSFSCTDGRASRRRKYNCLFAAGKDSPLRQGAKGRGHLSKRRKKVLRRPHECTHVTMHSDIMPTCELCQVSPRRHAMSSKMTLSPRRLLLGDALRESIKKLLSVSRARARALSCARSASKLTQLRDRLFRKLLAQPTCTFSTETAPQRLHSIPAGVRHAWTYKNPHGPSWRQGFTQ